MGIQKPQYQINRHMTFGRKKKEKLLCWLKHWRLQIVFIIVVWEDDKDIL